MNSTGIKIKNITKEFLSIRGRIVALRDINIEVEGGEFFVLLGPSGCGKSTLLNILAGLEKPTHGDVWFDEDLVVSTEKKLFSSPKERNVAMVFQTYALYPHMTVFENIAFPLKILKDRKSDIKTRVNEAVRLLDIQNLLYAKPRELSGGQRQRVAMGRAIVRHPRVFLLDEPLSNLDAKLRSSMRSELKALQKKLGVTTIYVTHDQVEAMTLGNRIAVINEGVIQQVGRPMEVFENPANTFVAGFLGTPPMNLLESRLTEEYGEYFIQIDDIRLKLPDELLKNLKGRKDRKLFLGVRAEDIKVAPEYKGENAIQVEVSLLEKLGQEVLLHFRLGKNPVVARLPKGARFKDSELIVIEFDLKRVHLFDEAGRRIEI